ncbi:hypothetical protein EDD17DRAFT_1502834 [Pisolithus thermaeus]|nr:hypothetical protein EDD17DRAFT_1502834 [Pisolithus thermaeus]
MPSSCPVFKRCKCEECLESDANGILMDARVMPAHLKRVQVERSSYGNRVVTIRKQDLAATSSPGTLTTLQIPNIVDSLNCLQLHDAQPVDEPWTVPQSSPDSLASIITGDRLPKKDRHQFQRAYTFHVRQELDLLRHAMEGVKHGHHSIDSYKKGIVTGLDKLEAQLRLHEPLESSVDPVFFKISKFYSC